MHILTNCYKDWNKKTLVAILVQVLRGLCVTLMICHYCVQQQEDPRKWYLSAANLRKNILLFLIRPICPDVYLYLNGEKLEWTDIFKHIGNIITADQKDDSDIQLKHGYFYRSVNGLCCKFKCVQLNSDVAARLFPAYFCSFYGSQLWNLSNLSFENIAQHGTKQCEEFLTCHTIHIDICFPILYKPDTSEISWWTGSGLSSQPVCRVKVY